MPLAAVLLIIINLGLVWLLLAAPVGTRTIRLRRILSAEPRRVWAAMNPMGADASWRASVISCENISNSRTRHFHSNYDRSGKPIEMVYEVDSDVQSLSYRARVVEDSALDPSFWSHYHEDCHLEVEGQGTRLYIERTDHYRGLAFLIFRYFNMRRELDALGGWLATGRTTRGGVFERPSTQFAMAVVSTLLLWPFFGLDAHGLLLSTMLTVVIALHELGHMAAYRSFGHQSVRMVFIPFLGGIAIGGRPYNSRFEIAVCALMGAGLSGFIVPLVIRFADVAKAEGMAAATQPALVFLLILGAFNLLNLLPMHRFDGGQVIRQVFRGKKLQMLSSFAVAGAVLFTGWEIGLPDKALLSGLAVFALLSIMGKGEVKPRHEMIPMSNPERLMAGLGLAGAVLIHAYAVIIACRALFGA